MQSLRQAQMQALEEAWTEITPGARPERYLRSQQDKMFAAAAAASTAGNASSSIVGVEGAAHGVGGADAECASSSSLDPYDLTDPVAVISKLSADW